MVTYASRGAWLRTGDVLGSGTCGFGCLGELWGRNGRLEPRPLAPGDEVTLSVEAIGTLTNRIVAGVDPLPVPKARARQGAVGMSTRYLKAPNPPTTQATDELRARVSEILRDIERGGLDAVRRYSREFDGWAPDDFVVSEPSSPASEAELDDELKRHIAFAQDQVRGFAEAQLGTLTPLEVEMGPGVVLGHRHIPVNAVGAYVPGGRYPDAGVVVHDGPGGQGGRRQPGRRLRAAAA